MDTDFPQSSGPCFNLKTIFPGMVIIMLKIRRSPDRLIFDMGIPILVRQHLYIETAPQGDIIWAPRHLNWPAPGLFVQKLIQDNPSSASLVFCAGNLSVTSGFPAQMVSYVESIPYHDVIIIYFSLEDMGQATNTQTSYDTENIANLPITSSLESEKEETADIIAYSPVYIMEWKLMEIDNDNDTDGDAEGMPTFGKLAWESLTRWNVACSVSARKICLKIFLNNWNLCWIFLKWGSGIIWVALET